MQVLEEAKSELKAIDPAMDKKKATQEEIECNPTARHLLHYGNIIEERHLIGLVEWRRNGLSLAEVVELVNMFGPIRPWSQFYGGYTRYFFMPLCAPEMREMYASNVTFQIFVTKLQQEGKFTCIPGDLDWWRLARFVEEVVFDARNELLRVGVVENDGTIHPEAMVRGPRSIIRISLT